MKTKDEPNNMNILSDEEIVRMAREGSSSAYEFLIGKYRNLAKTIARKYYITGGDNEDVVQEGMIGIFKAVRSFDSEGGSGFYTFVSLCIERQIQNAVSGANREKHRPLNESIPLFSKSDEEGSSRDAIEKELLNQMTTPEEEEPEKLALLRETFSELKALSKEVLSPLEEEVFSGMLQGKTYKEIAEEMDREPKSIDNAMQRIRRKIGISAVDL